MTPSTRAARFTVGAVQYALDIQTLDGLFLAPTLCLLWRDNAGEWENAGTALWQANNGEHLEVTPETVAAAGGIVALAAAIVLVVNRALRARHANTAPAPTQPPATLAEQVLDVLGSQYRASLVDGVPQLLRIP